MRYSPQAEQMINSIGLVIDICSRSRPPRPCGLMTEGMCSSWKGKGEGPKRGMKLKESGGRGVGIRTAGKTTLGPCLPSSPPPLLPSAKTPSSSSSVTPRFRILFPGSAHSATFMRSPPLLLPRFSTYCSCSFSTLKLRSTCAKEIAAPPPAPCLLVSSHAAMERMLTYLSSSPRKPSTAIKCYPCHPCHHGAFVPEINGSNPRATICVVPAC